MPPLCNRAAQNFAFAVHPGGVTGPRLWFGDTEMTRQIEGDRINGDDGNPEIVAGAPFSDNKSQGTFRMHVHTRANDPRRPLTYFEVWASDISKQHGAMHFLYLYRRD